jgi:drug/metabolite transporter (DMT)-like permease
MIIQYQPMLWWQVLFLLGAGCMAAGAQFSLTAAYTYAPAKSISVYDYTQVLFTALWGLLFLSELPDWISIIGYVIIIGAALAKYMVARNEGKSKKSE